MKLSKLLTEKTLNLNGFLEQERVKTYHSEDSRATNHASGEKCPFDQVVFGKSIGELIEARKLAKLEEN